MGVTEARASTAIAGVIASGSVCRNLVGADGDAISLLPVIPGCAGECGRHSTNRSSVSPDMPRIFPTHTAGGVTVVAR